MPCAGGWSTCSRPARRWRCGSTSSATRSRACASFDPADQRTTDRIDGFTLLPASEALLDAESIKRFRARYRELFGATATGDPLYQALSEGRRLAGMEHWLPLLEEKLATFFDHLAPNDLRGPRRRRRQGGGSTRFEAIADYHGNRVRQRSADPGSYRPLEPGGPLPQARSEWDRLLADRPVHLATPFHEPESARVIDFGVDAARDFTPERAQNANVYEAVAAHVRALGREKRKVVLASYSVGARERLKGLLSDHGFDAAMLADDWQDALGARLHPRHRRDGRCCRWTMASPPRRWPC